MALIPEIETRLAEAAELAREQEAQAYLAGKPPTAASRRKAEAAVADELAGARAALPTLRRLALAEHLVEAEHLEAAEVAAGEAFRDGSELQRPHLVAAVADLVADFGCGMLGGALNLPHLVGAEAIRGLREPAEGSPRALFLELQKAKSAAASHRLPPELEDAAD